MDRSAAQPQSDRVLIERTFLGDQAAFESLVNRYNPLLLAFVRRSMTDDGQREDRVPFVWLQFSLFLPPVYPHFSYVPRAVPLRAWLLRVATNSCIDEERQKYPLRFSDLLSFRLHAEEAQKATLAEEHLVAPLPLAEEVAQRRDLQWTLHTTIDTLPGKFRRSVRLRYTHVGHARSNHSQTSSSVKIILLLVREHSLEKSHRMEHAQKHLQQQTNNYTFTFRDGVALAIVFGGSPALFLSFIFWAVATAYPQAGPLSRIMAFLITLLLSLLAVILVVRHVDISVLSLRKYMDSTVDELLIASIGTGIACLFLAVSTAFCLSRVSTLEGWHYTLIMVEIVLVGYQIATI